MNTTDLEQMGLCKSIGMPAAVKGLSPGAKALVLALERAGEEGLSRTGLKQFLAMDADCISLLEIRMLVSWLRNNRGEQSRLVLTWKGQDAAEALRRTLRNRQSSPWLAAKARDRQAPGSGDQEAQE
jgi:hypothetical protein